MSDKEQAGHGVEVDPDLIDKNVTNDHLERVLKKAYRFAAGDTKIDSHELVDDICEALCDLMGYDNFCQWNDLEE